jgi:hypothetical protein
MRAGGFGYSRRLKLTTPDLVRLLETLAEPVAHIVYNASIQKVMGER